MKNSYYTVKVATFTVSKFADSQYESLKKKGYDVFIESAGGFGRKKSYTVSVGKVKSSEEAEKVAETIRTKERLKAEVVELESG
jgi:cell division septation protein DedD